MDSSGLRRAQVEILGGQVARQLRYLNRLCERMQRLGFPPNDPMVRAANKAQEGMQELFVQCHYLTCESGVGR